jgi:hypothetical protein
MVADVIITVCILYGLWKSRTGWSNTDRVISRLIRMTLEAQVPPLIFAIGYLSYVSQEPSSLLGAVFLGCQPYIYGICLLYTLNSRQRWKDNRHMTMVSVSYKS